MSFDPAARLQAFHDAINALDFEAIEAFFAEDAAYLSGGTGDMRGREAIMAAFRAYFADYPDQVAWNDKVETLGPDRARSFWNLKATYAQTGRPLVRRGIETITFDGTGRIVEVLVEDR